MWNAFKLMTSLSWNDVITQGSSIGFFPDDPLSWGYNDPQVANSRTGAGTLNNLTTPANGVIQANPLTSFNTYSSTNGNVGFTKRIQYINFDINATPLGVAPYSDFLPQVSVNNLWKSYIYNKSNLNNSGLLQIAVSATVYLKHVHSFFAMCPLLKGVFIKMTMNLNNCSSSISVIGSNTALSASTVVDLISSSVPVGGVLPIMLASTNGTTFQGAGNLGGITQNNANPATYTLTLSVGGRCLNPSVATRGDYLPSPLAQSVYLYIPAYTFNPVFEQAYLSSPIKQIKYTDVYQYQVLNVGANQQFNNLITNGIANIKSVLILPYFASDTGLPVGIPVYQSPFDPAGCGCTSPLCLLTNFNVVISGQNAIYNTQRYAFEQFNNQLYGQNAVNGGLTDGLTSSLINSLGFEMEYCYYYVNVSRMLPVEESVPKSVQIIGTNSSASAVNLFVFVEYGVDVSIDILSGARV